MFDKQIFGRAAIRAADQYWFLAGYVLVLPYYHIVLHFTCKAYSLKRNFLVKLEEGNIPALPLLYFKSLYFYYQQTTEFVI
jgi:hypothetical protein